MAYNYYKILLNIISMLKKRIIPLQLYDDQRLVKTIQFKNPRDVGDPVKSSKIYSDQDADELIILNISRFKKNNLKNLIELLTKISEEVFMPLSVGGGITSYEQVEELFYFGADKVIINTAAYSNKQLINSIANRFGKQSITIGIDVKKIDNQLLLYSQKGDFYEKISLKNHIKNVINEGAGEIFIQNIDRDGMMNGYDLETIKYVVENSTVPVIASGGSGNYMHMLEAFNITKVSGLCCGSLFNFGDNNPIRAKAFLKNYDINLKII